MRKNMSRHILANGTIVNCRYSEIDIGIESHTIFCTRDVFILRLLTQQVTINDVSPYK